MAFGRGATAGPWCLGCGVGGSGDLLQGGITQSQHHLGAHLGWCVYWVREISWFGRCSRTMGSSLLGVEFSGASLDMYNTTQDRSSLTSMVMLTSLSAFGGEALMGLGIKMGKEWLPRGGALSSGPSVMGCGMSTFRYMGLPPSKFGLWPVIWAGGL